MLALAVPHSADHPPAQPSWVDPAMRSLSAGTKVVDSWDWGGYLMWRYPQLDLLMHGYGDTFTVSELQRNTDIVGSLPAGTPSCAGPGARSPSSGRTVPWRTRSSIRSIGESSIVPSMSSTGAPESWVSGVSGK